MPRWVCSVSRPARFQWIYSRIVPDVAAFSLDMRSRVRHNYTYNVPCRTARRAKPMCGRTEAANHDAKRDALQQSSGLNPRPQDVQDELFRTNEFFDPRDLVQ